MKTTFNKIVIALLQMKIRIIGMALVLVMILFVNGCDSNGNISSDMAPSADDDVSSSSSPSTAASSEENSPSVAPSPMISSIPAAPSTVYEVGADTSLSVPEAELPSALTWPAIPEGAEALSDEEMAFFTDYFSDRDNLVFIQNEYAKPEDVDADIIFYSGVSNSSLSGRDISSLPEDEQEALRAVDRNADRLDISKVTTKEVNEFLLDKVGLTLDQLSKGFTVFTYLEDYDAYYLSAGGTGYDIVTLGPGYIEENDNVVIYYLTRTEQAFGKVTLHQSDNKYYFLSNERINEK